MFHIKIWRSMKEFLHFYLFEHLPKNKINGISAGELIGWLWHDNNLKMCLIISPKKYFSNIEQSFVCFNWVITDPHLGLFHYFIYHTDQISFPVLQIFNISFFVCSEIFPISLCFVLFQCKVSQVGEKAESTNWKTLETLKYTVQRITDFTHIN